LKLNTETVPRMPITPAILIVTLAFILGGSPLPAHANSLEEASQSLKSGQHARALEQIDKYLGDKPKDAQGRFLKGIILTGLNKQNEAITVFKKLAEDYPELPEPYNNLAVIYAQQKQYEKAKEALEMAIRTHPAYATAHENLGDIYSRLASQAYGKALQIDASNASAQTKLAMINDLVGSSKVSAGKTPTPPAPAPMIVAAAEPPKPAPAVKPEAVKPDVPKPIESVRSAEIKSAPTPKHEPSKSDAGKSGDSISEITTAIDNWLVAWSKKDVKGYLSFYAKDFQTPKGLSRKEWETERAQRVGKPGKIDVGHDKLSIKIESGDKAVVRFRQQYKSANLSTASGKTLVMVKHEGKWLIQQERVGG
jgi:ketosteroid isomerase-like protein